MDLPLSSSDRASISHLMIRSKIWIWSMSSGSPDSMALATWARLNAASSVVADDAWRDCLRWLSSDAVGLWSRYEVNSESGAGVVAEGVCAGAMASSCFNLRRRVSLNLRFSDRCPLSGLVSEWR